MLQMEQTATPRKSKSGVDEMMSPQRDSDPMHRMKTIGLLGSVCLLTNNVTGPGMIGERTCELLRARDVPHFALSPFPCACLALRFSFLNVHACFVCFAAIPPLYQTVSRPRRPRIHCYPQLNQSKGSALHCYPACVCLWFAGFSLINISFRDMMRYGALGISKTLPLLAFAGWLGCPDRPLLSCWCLVGLVFIVLDESLAIGSE